MPPPDLSAGTKTLIGAVLGILLMLATYLGVKTPCEECPVCPPPVATAPAP